MREYMREMCGIDGAACTYDKTPSCDECPVLARVRQTQAAGQKLAADIQRGVYKGGG